MICDRCGELVEVFITEGHGELCEACQGIVQEENRKQFGRGRAKGLAQDGEVKDCQMDKMHRHSIGMENAKEP